MRNYSIDIETFGTKTNAPVVSIGACHFDIDNGDTISTFEVNCLPTKNSVYDLDTVMWWLKQDEDPRKQLTDGYENSITMFDALLSLNTYLTDNACTVSPWGNGATFDISILEFNYESENINIPWDFWNIRDMRTIVSTAQCIGFDKKSIIREGTYHSALDDAIYQAKVISAAHNVLTR